MKINNFPSLQQEIAQNFSTFIDSSSETCEDSSFNEVHYTHLLLLRHSLVRLSRHTHTPKCNEPAITQTNYNCGLTILIVSLFSLGLLSKHDVA